MEKILSDVQLAEVDVKYYEILRDDAMRDKCHTLAYVWQEKAQEAKKILETKLWEKYLEDELDPRKQEELCEGCHRKEEICICGGIPDEF